MISGAASDRRGVSLAPLSDGGRRAVGPLRDTLTFVGFTTQTPVPALWEKHEKNRIF